MNKPPWITDPGQYDLDEDEYHGDPVVAGSLSSTGARTIVKASPARYAYDRLHGRPNKPHFDEGRAAHAVVLGTGAPMYVPCDEHGEPYKRWDSDVAKAKVAHARSIGAIPVKDDVKKRVLAMAAALREHEKAGPLFARPGKAEQSFVARDPDTNIMVRIRVDWMPDVPPGESLLVVDYKGTTCAHPHAFAKTMADYGYDQQGPFYVDALTWLPGADDRPTPKFVLVAQEKEPPYLVTVAQPDPNAMAGGRELNREALDLYRRCTAANHWPGYDEAVAQLAPPGWRLAQYEAAAARRQNRQDLDLIGAFA